MSAFAGGRLPVWVWYDYNASGPPRYVQLNLQALCRHTPASHFVVHFVNRTNVAQHVPDLPEAFWRLPTHVAFSDAARLGLLAHHGGLYLDTDFLVMRSLLPIVDLLQRVQVVGYPVSPPHGNALSSAACAASGHLSANFLASRANTTMFRRAWDLFRKLLPRQCSRARARKVYICCRDAHTNAPLDRCNVPHATTDLMLQRAGKILPDVVGANDTVVSLAGGAALHRASNTTVYCLGGDDDLTTPRLRAFDTRHGKDSDTSLPTVLGTPLLGTRLCYGKWRLLSRAFGCEVCPIPPAERYRVCCSREGDDLVCHNHYHKETRLAARSIGFFSRTRLAYHLFDSFQRKEFLLRDEIESSNLTVAPLYRRALGLSAE